MPWSRLPDRLARERQGAERAQCYVAGGFGASLPAPLLILKDAARSGVSWVLFGTFFICGLSTDGLIQTHFIPLCGDYGLAAVSAAGILAMMGVLDFFGTLGSGWLSDRFDNRWLLFWPVADLPASGFAQGSGSASRRCHQGGCAAHAVLIKRYTRPSHRGARAEGCPIAALCGDVARPERKGPIRAAFGAGLSSLVARLAPLIAGKRKKVPREEVLATLSLLVGALVLARATEEQTISEEFLSSARKVLLER